jgi:predicted PurR-regulated permease PerM
MLSDKPFTFDRVVRIAIAVGVLWGLISLVAYLSDVLIPFALALLLAYLINPFVAWVQRSLRLRNRALAVLASLALLLTGLTLLGLALIPMILDELAHMRNLLNRVVADAASRNETVGRLPAVIWAYVVEFAGSETFRNLLTFENLKEVARQVLPGVWGFFSGAMSFLLGLFGLVVVLLYLVFILVDYEAVTEGWKDLIPPQYRELVVGVLADFTGAMRNYFRAQALIACIVGVLHAFGFWLIGLPMGILLGLFIGLLNMVPYLQVIGFVPAILFAMISSVETGASVWGMVLLVVLVFAAVQILQDALLTPRIMGKVTGFNPAVILLSVTVWGKLLGVLGVIIALPITFLLHSYYRRFLDTHPER